MLAAWIRVKALTVVSDVGTWIACAVRFRLPDAEKCSVSAGLPTGGSSPGVECAPGALVRCLSLTSRAALFGVALPRVMDADVTGASLTPFELRS